MNAFHNEHVKHEIRHTGFDCMGGLKVRQNRMTKIPLEW